MAVNTWQPVGLLDENEVFLKNLIVLTTLGIQIFEIRKTRVFHEQQKFPGSPGEPLEPRYLIIMGSGTRWVYGK